MSSALTEVADQLRARGGLLADATVDPPPAGADFDTDPVVEAIREGELAHYGGARIVAAEPDLALLAGDRLYALGLAELARREDLESVALLAAVIARCAQAHAEGRPQDAEVAWGRVTGHTRDAIGRLRATSSA